jgi:hypothetical protein
MTQEFDPSKSVFIVAVGTGLVGGHTNTIHTFPVQCKDTNNNDYTQSPGDPVTVWGTSNLTGPEILDFSFEDDDTGLIVFKYVAPTPGDYIITVKGNGINIVDSPRTNYPVTIVGPTPSESTATGTGVTGGSGTVGTTVTFTVTAKDENGDPFGSGNDNFQVTVIRANKVIPCNFVGNGDGTYSGSYFVSKAGLYYVSITLDGINIAGSQFSFTHTP